MCERERERRVVLELVYSFPIRSDVGEGRRDWNREFQEANAQVCDDSFFESLRLYQILLLLYHLNLNSFQPNGREKFVTLSALSRDFIYCSKTYGRIIIRYVTLLFFGKFSREWIGIMKRRSEFAAIRR